jgi:hypothetical protein
MDANGEITKEKSRDSLSPFKRFLRSYKASIQAFSLLLALLMPFLLYDALQKGDYILALITFSLIGFSMLLVILV